MVIIHPFHRILEVACHSSALSHRQVADCDYRVPEVIDRHSFKHYLHKKAVLVACKYYFFDSKNSSALKNMCCTVVYGNYRTTSLFVVKTAAAQHNNNQYITMHKRDKKMEDQRPTYAELAAQIRKDAAKREEDAAKRKEDATNIQKLSETNEKLSETNEKLSETNEKLSETNKKFSETMEKLSETMEMAAIVTVEDLVSKPLWIHNLTNSSAHLNSKYPTAFFTEIEKLPDLELPAKV